MKKTVMIQPLIPPQAAGAAFHPNSALGRLIQADSNPYHALHIAKAFALKSPKLNHTQPQIPMVGNPWEMMGKK